MNEISENKSGIIIIGLIGSIGSGRTAISQFIYYSYGFVKINFSDSVKEVGKILGKVDIESLQAIRHTMRESLGGDVWLNLMEKRIYQALVSKLVKLYSIPGVSEVKPVLRIVIDDIAYRNEFNFVKERNGLLIGLKASEENLYKRVENRGNAPSFMNFKKWLEHPSEEEIPVLIEDCDFIIDTDNLSLLEVEERVNEIVKGYLMQ